MHFTPSIVSLHKEEPLIFNNCDTPSHHCPRSRCTMGVGDLVKGCVFRVSLSACDKMYTVPRHCYHKINESQMETKPLLDFTSPALQHVNRVVIFPPERRGSFPLCSLRPLSAAHSMPNALFDMLVWEFVKGRVCHLVKKYVLLCWLKVSSHLDSTHYVKWSKCIYIICGRCRTQKTLSNQNVQSEH